MLKFNIEELQNIIQKPIRRNCKSLGLDTATRTGWALITTNDKTMTIDYGFIHVDSKDQYVRLNEYVKQFTDLIKKDYRVIIEDSFFGGNALVLKFLAKLEGIAYAVAIINGVTEKPIMIGPSSARKFVGCKGNTKKPEVHQWIKDNLNIKLMDEDASDAVILAIVGVIDNAQS